MASLTLCETVFSYLQHTKKEIPVQVLIQSNTLLIFFFYQDFLQTRIHWEFLIDELCNSFLGEDAGACNRLD